jgi:hypothetical protein
MAACLRKIFENLGNILPLKLTAVVCSFVLLNEFKSSGFKKLEYFHQSAFQLLPFFVF